MRKRPDFARFAFWISVFMPTVIAIVALPFLPDQIPAHAGFNGVVDRYGSKYEVLIMALPTIVLMFIFQAITKYASKQEKNKDVFVGTRSILYWVFAAADLLFSVITLGIIFSAFANFETFPILSLYALISIAFGMVIILIGCLLPQMKQNTILGIRTKATLANGYGWSKTHKFGGIVFVVVGSIIVITGIVFSNTLVPIIILFAGMITGVSICLVYASKIAKTRTKEAD